MKRFLLTFVAVTSVLLLGVVATLWARSARFGEAAEKQIMYTEGISHLASSRGVFTVVWLSVPDPDPMWRYQRHAPPPEIEVLHADHTKPVWNVSGLAYRAGGISKDHVHQLILPYWMLAAPLAAVAVVTGLHAARLRRRRRPGLCCRCGYDLRASPERCPECGIAHQV